MIEVDGGFGKRKYIAICDICSDIPEEYRNTWLDALMYAKKLGWYCGKEDDDGRVSVVCPACQEGLKK